MDAIKRPNKINMASYIVELMNSATLTHMLHLSITGQGSYATHLALQEYYEGIIDPLDNLAEQYQGVSGMLLSFPGNISLNRFEDITACINYMNGLYSQAEQLQAECKHSEVAAILDTIKEFINKLRYKLRFLK